MKSCPFCAEEIQDAAVVCKHCGRDLKGGASQVQIVQPKKGLGCAGMGCLGVLALFVFVGISNSLMPSAPKPSTAAPASAPPEPTTVRLQADAKYSNTQVEIDNVGPSDWTDVRIEINGGLLTGGFNHRVAKIAHAHSYKVGLLQFVDSSGNRFNPFQKKIQKIVITAKVDGKDGIRILSVE